MDDKLLGEKAHYYCSSSEDEDEKDSDCESGDESKAVKEPTFIPEPKLQEYAGTCTNTGPKGVINDWREFKRLETEQKESQEQERQKLMKKLQLTCRSHLNDEEEQKKDEEFLKEFEELEDEFLKEYRLKRIEEMRRALETQPKFGRVVSIGKDDFIAAIDQEKSGVKIIVHIYEENVEACEAMSGCLSCLAQEYPHIKFCKIKASDFKMSKNFSINGVPALLIYKNGELIGNYIRLSDEFGEDFYATEVESFLQEHGILPQTEIKIIRDATTGEVRGVFPKDLEDEDEDLD